MDREPDDMSELRDDLRATAEDLAADADRVGEIERKKKTLPPGDPKGIELARESEQVTAEMAEKAKIETALMEQGEPETGQA
jgi:hypothetical protein